MSTEDAILVIDDDKGMLNLLSDILREEYTVFTAPDGVAGIDHLKEASFRAAVVDVKMPGMDGIQVLKRIKQTCPDVEVVMLTAYASLDSAIEAMKLGAYDYLTKPFKGVEVKKVLRNAVRKHKLVIENRRLLEELKTANGRLKRELAERKQAEEALRRSEARYRDLYEEAPVAYFLADADGSILRANRCAVKLLGHTISSLIGRAVLSLCADTPEGKEKAQGVFLRLCAGEVAYGEEIEMLRADGGSEWVSLTARPILDSEGRVVEGHLIAVDVTELKRVDEALRELSKRIIQLQEEERRRVVRELHDGVNQILSSVKFRLELIEGKMSGLNESLLEEVGKTKSLLDRAIQEIRRISKNLRPSVLDDIGLIAALSSLCDEFVERTGKDVELGSLGLSERLPSEIETTLYRVVQEALNNVEKHSQATKVILLLSQEGSLLTVSMKDDGRGFDPILVERREAEERGLGLSNIKERVGFVGGTSAIRSSPGCGVEILIKIPLNG